MLTLGDHTELEVRISFDKHGIVTCDLKEVLGETADELPKYVEVNYEIYRNGEGFAFYEYDNPESYEIIFNKQERNQDLYKLYFRIQKPLYIDDCYGDGYYYDEGHREWPSIYSKKWNAAD